MIELLVAAALNPTHRDIITTGGLIVCTVVTTLGGVQIAKINKVGRGVEQAVEQTKTTGNGFAGTVMDELQYIRRELGGIRADNRATDARIDRVDTKVDRLDSKIDRHIEETR